IKADVVPCVKHFPGHGNTLIDSHEDLPIENMTLDELSAGSLQPFKKAFRSRADLVMMAHILFPQIDPDFPATLSEVFIQKILKNDCRYRGLIVTDDLGMKALTKHHTTEEIAVRALQVGVDLLLYCNDFEAPPKAMEALIEASAQGPLNADAIHKNSEKILQYKLSKIKNPDPLPFAEVKDLIGNQTHQLLAKAIQAGHVPNELIDDKSDN
ncbi:MAG: glycoside hydrolase family 3 N-terminal domain-containing protein, partial [Bdellovibrionales bacterium]